MVYTCCDHTISHFPFTFFKAERASPPVVFRSAHRPPPHHNPHEGPAFNGNNRRQLDPEYYNRLVKVLGKEGACGDTEYYNRLVNMLGREGADEIVKDSVNETFIEAALASTKAAVQDERGADAKEGSNEKKSSSGVQEPQKLSDRMDTVPKKSPVSVQEAPYQKQESSSKQRSTSNNNDGTSKYPPPPSYDEAQKHKSAPSKKQQPISSNDNDVEQPMLPSTPIMQGCTFPYKLYAALEDESSSGAIEWLDHGRAFRILDKDTFERKVLKAHFRAKKIRSFQRQLNLWGFCRVVVGPDIGAWWHPYLIRNHPENMKHISRVGVGIQSQAANKERPHYSGSSDQYQMHAHLLQYSAHQFHRKLSADHYAQQDRYAQALQQLQPQRHQLQRQQHQQQPSYNITMVAMRNNLYIQKQANTNRQVSNMYQHLYPPNMSSNQSDRDHPRNNSTNNQYAPCNVQHFSTQTSYTCKALQRAATPRECNDTASSTSTDETSKSEAETSSKSDDAEKNTAVYLTKDAIAHLNSVDPLKGLDCLADVCAFHSKS